MEVKRKNPRYRPGSSRNAGSASRFRRQMADHAKADRFRQLRADHPDRPSRERVAADIGVSTKTVYAWENGSGIDWDNAKAAARYYGVDPESLVTRDPAGGNPYAEQLDRIEEKLDEILRRLDEGEGLPERLPDDPGRGPDIPGDGESPSDPAAPQPPAE